MSKKPLAEIYEDETGWHIRTDAEGFENRQQKDVWIDTFPTEEEATTYALRNGCRVEGC
jgi:hypothetical protein